MFNVKFLCMCISWCAN